LRSVAYREEVPVRRISLRVRAPEISAISR
jgi:hypothetical protein